MRLGALRHVGVQAALASAALFGASTPLAKLLLGTLSPWLLAGLLYTGSGLGLGLYRLARRSPRVRLPRGDVLPFAGAILAGGIIGPVLLMAGLSAMPATGASLLLNAESVFTATLAWFVFKENLDRRVAAGMLAILAGAVVLSVPHGADLASPWPSLAVLGACAAWGLDNNLTRTVALTDATWLAAIKGLVAGPVNLTIAFTLGARLPAPPGVAAALSLGFAAYGLSLVLFVLALRHLGTARAGAYFSVAPFVGALLALALGESLTPALLAGGTLMGLGVWLHLSERHAHLHAHPLLTHEHWHTHDADHQHQHEPPAASAAGHTHQHTHPATTHTHEHYPDSHHRHDH